MFLIRISCWSSGRIWKTFHIINNNYNKIIIMSLRTTLHQLFPPGHQAQAPIRLSMKQTSLSYVFIQGIFYVLAID